MLSSDYLLLVWFAYLTYVFMQVIIPVFFLPVLTAYHLLIFLYLTLLCWFMAEKELCISCQVLWSFFNAKWLPRCQMLILKVVKPFPYCRLMSHDRPVPVTIICVLVKSILNSCYRYLCIDIHFNPFIPVLR